MANLKASATYSDNRNSIEAKGTLELSDDVLSFVFEDNRESSLEIPITQISKVIIGTPTIIKTSDKSRYFFNLTDVNQILMTRAVGGVVEAAAEQKVHLDEWFQAFKQSGVSVRDHTAKRTGKLYAIGALIVFIIIVIFFTVLG